MPSTRKDFGNDLTAVTGIRQPSGTVEVDAYGVAQAQLIFAVDTDPANLAAVFAYYNAGQNYPEYLGWSMKSYRCHLSSSKAGIGMLTVDYMGIAREAGYSDPQIHGVINTTAQAIETHPNFTVSATAAGYAAGPLAGYADGTLFNNAMFSEPDDHNNRAFRGFGVTKSGEDLNVKAGVRQYLRPLTTVRGVMLFDESQQIKAEKLSQNVGCYFNNTDGSELISPDVVYGVVYGSRWLLTAANIECIGVPGNYAALKVTYDMMYGGVNGWDKDIYLQGETIF
jgi:hypothetical protein